MSFASQLLACSFQAPSFLLNEYRKAYVLIAIDVSSRRGSSNELKGKKEYKFARNTSLNDTIYQIKTEKGRKQGLIGKVIEENRDGQANWGSTGTIRGSPKAKTYPNLL